MHIMENVMDCSFFLLFLQMVPTCWRCLRKSPFPWTYLLPDSCSISFLHCLCCSLGCLPNCLICLDWPRCSCKDWSPIQFHSQLQSTVIWYLILLFYWLGYCIDHHSTTDCSCPKSEGNFLHIFIRHLRVSKTL